MTEYSNLEKHRRAVVDMACDVLCSAAGLPHEFDASGITLYADFEGEPLASADRPNAHRENILAVADACDGVYLYTLPSSKNPDDVDTQVFGILILWGNGVGNCVADYSVNLDAVEKGPEDTIIQDLMDHVEFLEI